MMRRVRSAVDESGNSAQVPVQSESLRNWPGHSQNLHQTAETRTVGQKDIDVR